MLSPFLSDYARVPLMWSWWKVRRGLVNWKINFETHPLSCPKWKVFSIKRTFSNEIPFVLYCLYKFGLRKWQDMFYHWCYQVCVIVSAASCCNQAEFKSTKRKQLGSKIWATEKVAVELQHSGHWSDFGDTELSPRGALIPLGPPKVWHRRGVRRGSQSGAGHPRV